MRQAAGWESVIVGGGPAGFPYLNSGTFVQVKAFVRDAVNAKGSLFSDG